MSGIAEAFKDSLTNTFRNHPTEVEPFLQAYGINNKATDLQAMDSILRFATDIGFYASSLTIAQAWPRKAHVYHFNEPNPWDGPAKGESSHILDIAFLFRNYNEYLSDQQRATAEKFAENFISFVNGKEPFPSYTPGEGGAMVYGQPADGSTFVKGSKAENYGRRRTVFEFADRVGLDTLSAAWDNFLGGH
jgi:carboxylesterase type B